MTLPSTWNQSVCVPRWIVGNRSWVTMMCFCVSSLMTLPVSNDLLASRSPFMNQTECVCCLLQPLFSCTTEKRILLLLKSYKSLLEESLGSSCVGFLSSWPLRAENVLELTFPVQNPSSLWKSTYLLTLIYLDNVIFFSFCCQIGLQARFFLQEKKCQCEMSYFLST